MIANTAIRLRATVVAGLMLTAASSVFAQTALDLRDTTLAGVSAYEPVQLLTFAGLVAAQQTPSPRLSDVAAAIEAIYREDGYFLATAYVSADGKSIVVDEGEIGEIAVEGVDARTYRLVQA